MTSLMHGMRVWRSGIAWLLLLAYLPACTSWHIGTPTPAQFVETEHPQSVRVTRTDGTTIQLQSPMIRGDSLVGTISARPAREDSSKTVSLALSDVRFVEVKRTSTGKTLLAVGGGLALGIVVLALIECSGASGWEAIGCP